jgi:hypothetical protein
MKRKSNTQKIFCKAFLKQGGGVSEKYDLFERIGNI